METRFIDTDRGRFFLRLWGNKDAQPILFLHGFPEYSGAWAEVGEELADRYLCIAPDQRGFGQSEAPPEVSAYALSELVADMAMLMGQWDTPMPVVGHDWGAAVAYGLAMFRPDLVSRLVILNGVHPVPFQRELAAGGAQSEASQYILWLRREGSDAKLAEDDFAMMDKLFAARMRLSWMDEARLAEYKTEWGRPGRLRGMTNWYRASPLVVAEPGKPVTPPALPEDRLHITAPHLLIWGMRDTALLPESYAGLDHFCDGGLRIEQVADADHWIAHQQPRLVADAIARFVG